MIVEIPAKLQDDSDVTLVFRRGDRYPDGWYLRENNVEYQVRPNQLGDYLASVDDPVARVQLASIYRAVSSGTGWDTFRPPNPQPDGRYIPADIDSVVAHEKLAQLEEIDYGVQLALRYFASEDS